ncbi:hypothetical protein [Actinoplanes sp. NPDC026623]|uniref:hypothetical protein n=1 Tax=Actinoplanes sp. NPDC026623 TaxID=3155610 RepID=UPI0033FA163B
MPLVAGLDSARPAVHVWEAGPGGLQEVGVIDGDAAAYPPDEWKRDGLVPSLTWHPHEPSLVVAGPAGLRRWTPGGAASVVAGAPSNARCQEVAFSPDGRTLWASPASTLDDDEAWQYSDALDLDTGALLVGPHWDTGVAEHPGGGVVVTLSSDQARTDLLFARPGGGVPATMRVLRDAIVLDADCYELPVFSDDGRYLAVRGNAYVETLDVFEFPTMRKVLHTSLGEPYPGYPYPPAWLEEQARWSRHTVAFAPRTGVLLVGTSRGAILELDVEEGRVSEHDVAAAPISALAVTSTGRLVVADRSGQLAVIDVPGNAGRDTRQVTAAAARARAEEFLAATAELPDGADLETSLIRHDGQRAWSAGDLETVTTAEDADPIWLRLRAAINTNFQAPDDPA